MAEYALVVKDLEKTYAAQGGRPGTHALKNVSLAIQKGDFFALLGPNGAGKTTIIGIVTGLVTKSGGKAWVHGIDLDETTEKA